jgi:sterol desaturase/sphingolipid hydroxylase (fatty acid hydroxylase superfamily)
MEWVVATVGECREYWAQTLGWVAGLAAAFAVLTRLTPCNPGMYWWKDLRAAGTDLVYWFVVPLVLRFCRTLMLVAGVALLFGGADPQPLPVRGLPLWVQCAGVLLLQDFLLYWLHRLFHTRRAWRFHAVHHSPEVLDWTSSGRSHPVNTLLTFVLADVVVLLLGFSPAALLVLAPFNLVYSTMVHANLNWTFGPLRYVFASPVFHRWHHTTHEHALDKNFASTFPFLDLLFGTYYMPPGKLPEEFGIGEPDFPQGFWGQLVHPLARKQSSPWRTAGLVGAGALAVVGLLGVGLVYTARLAERNDELAREMRRAQAGQYALQVDLARRAWADNDLARAGAILNQVADPFCQGEEYVRLRELCRRKCRALAGHAGAVLGVAVSADGRRVVSGGEDRTVRVWDAGGEELFTLKGHGRQVRSVAVSGDGRRVVSGSHDGTVKLWDAAGREERTLTGHAGAVLGVAVSADGRRVVSGGADLSARLWDAESGREERVLRGCAGAVLSVAVSAGGQRVVAAGGREVKVWDVRAGGEGRALAGHTDLVYAVAISAEGRRVASGGFDERVIVWDGETGRPLRSLGGHRGPVYAVAITPDGGRVVTGGKDGTVKLWDAAGRELLTLRGHTDSVTGVAMSADGGVIVSGGRDGAVKVWDVRECEHAGVGEALASGPGGDEPRPAHR